MLARTEAVQVDAFEIDVTEVRVSAYARCVEEGVCSPPNTTSSDCTGDYAQYRNFAKQGRENHPVNCVSWHQAKRYCNWRGKRLPSGAEWEMAARGEDGRQYPWGNEVPSCERTIMVSSKDGAGCGRWTTWPVGSKPRGASPFGVLDMAGNVWEWTTEFYRLPPNRGRANAPFIPQLRMFRGGSFYSSTENLESAAGGVHNAAWSAHDIGFRCAR